ncbi:MAG: cbb3-type cytochrome c oxidase subunit 3 [Steroidobacter sp.]
MMFSISIGGVRGLITLVLMLAFIGMVMYVYSKRNRDVYDKAARLPLEESAPVQESNRSLQ